LTSFLLFFIIKRTIGLRVSPEEEELGLDIGEHGTVAYPDIHKMPEPETIRAITGKPASSTAE
jgi:ammonium transporter